MASPQTLRRATAALSCTLVLLGGCGLTLDLDPPDAVPDAGRDAGALAVCGDGLVAPGEQCDDGNHVPGDGCEPDCTFTCKDDGECVVLDPRCGKGICSPEHVCVYEDIDEACELGDDENGQCIEGRCVSLACGNDELNEGEECDDGNHVPGDGCERDCTLTCDATGSHAGNRCSDGIACNGVEVCTLSNAGAPICQEAETSPDHLECVECDLVSGELRLIDDDRDGYASIELACDERGGDCDDADPRIYPGAPDFAVPGNGVDDDCDGEIDEDVVATCLRDADHDGYGASEGSMVAGPDMSCPADWIPAPHATSLRYDCDDTNADVFPGQSAYFVDPRPGCTGDLCWDYDCDGAHQRRWPREAQCLAILGRACEDQGWSLGSSLALPNCGERGTWTTCSGNELLCVPALVGTSRTQQCR